VNPAFITHLQHNWPLAAAVAGLLIYLPIVLVGGVFYSNQGSIVRTREPERYWRWVARLLILLLAASTVLVGSYFLSKH